MTRIGIPYKVSAVFGFDPKGDNGKDELIYYCPECINRKGTPDKKGKLYVNVHNYKYHCFRCGYSGQIGNSIKVDPNRVYNPDTEVPDNELYRMACEIFESDSEEKKFPLKIPLDKVIDSPVALNYLLQRGFTIDKINKYDLRVGNPDFEFGRIIIPNQVKHLIYTDYYTARSYVGQEPKYHNPRVVKSKIVYNLHRIKEGDYIILVEGPLTAIAAGDHAVATLGKTITRDQASQIIMKKPSAIFLNYDRGAEEYTEKACRLLKSMNPQLNLFQTFMPDDRDAADLTEEEYRAILQRSIPYNPMINDLIEIFK